MEQITLDLIPNGVMPNIHASQFDHGRTIRFNLCEGKSPFSLLATDYVKVACNDVESVSLANAGNSHDWTIPDSVVADSGIFIGELTIERGSVIVGSKNFVLNVEEDAYNGKNIEERTASGTIANFETNLQDNLTACKCEINALQSGSGTPSPNNPRPISGFNGATIVRCGKNFADIKPFADWTVIGSYLCYQNALPKNQNLYMSFEDNDISVDISGCYFGFLDDEYAGGAITGHFKWILNNGSYTANNNLISGPKLLNGFVMYPANETTYNKIMARYKIQVELGASSTAFEAYNGMTNTISFGQTVYGGVLDVTNGKLTITHKGETFTSVVNGAASSTASWFGQLLSSGAKPTNNNIKADIKADYLETVTASQVISVENNSIGVNTNGAINIKIQGMTSLADYNTYLANNPLTVVYELATPTEITLTPKQIEAIVGVNNVFHDCNGETEVKYLVEV